MISGECRVDTIPFGKPPNPSAGRKLAIDGLRLQLDLRIVPSAAADGDAAAAAVWRIEDARLATLPLGLASYRKFAVAAGLAAMLLALGMWFAQPPGTPTTTEESTRAPSVARVASPAAAPPPAPARPPPAHESSSSHAPAVDRASGGTTLSPASAAPVSAPPASRSPSSATPAASVHSPSALTGTRSVAAAGSRGPSAAAAQARAHTGSAPDDLLDLFADTK